MGESGDTPRYMSAQARYAAYAAKLCGFEFESLDGDDGYLFEVRDGARRAAFAAGAGSPYALNDVRAASIARDKAFCATVLRRANLPVIPGEMFFITPKWSEMRKPGREPDDAIAFARTASFPLFCKPLSASNGLYAEIVDDIEALIALMQHMARDHFAMLVQPYIRGVEHRVFVLDGRPVFSYRKALPHVTGDGVSTLRELVAALPVASGAPSRSVRARDLAGRPLGADLVLPLGDRATLEGAANRSAGGGAEHLASGAPPALAKLAVDAARVVGLRLAGVDVFDVSPQADLSDLKIIEVNSNPMIATLEDHDRWDLIAEIWRENLMAAFA